MKKVALDAVDVRILSAVQQHGQISKNCLAELVNLSATPCWLRLTKLKKLGLITGYQGIIAVDRIIDLTKVIVTISLNTHKKSDFDRFEDRIRSIDEVVECFATGGNIDYILKVMTSGLPDFQALIQQLLDEELGIDRYYIYVVTKEVKSSTLSLSKLMEIKNKSQE